MTNTAGSNHSYHYHDNNNSPDRQPPRSRSCSTPGTRRRPPSLERQDAFRDEKTAKRRRSADDYYHTHTVARAEEHRDLVEAAEVAELYRLGVLYDDEHERGEGFSLARISRAEEGYSVRYRAIRRSAKRGRREEDVKGEKEWVPSLGAVDLAFSAFGEDEALADWLLSSSYAALEPQLLAPRATAVVHHDTTRLTVIYELADACVDNTSTDDFLGSISVSDVSYCPEEEEEEEEEDELTWAVLDGCHGNEKESATPPVAVVEDEVGGDVDPWVVLGLDGS
jgi:hypothetical protein